MKLDNKEKGLFHLEYCIKLQRNQQTIEKAYKKLIVCFLEDSQFYEAVNVVELGDRCGIELEDWKRLVESLMNVVKGHHKEALYQF